MFVHKDLFSCVYCLYIRSCFHEGLLVLRGQSATQSEKRIFFLFPSVSSFGVRNQVCLNRKKKKKKKDWKTSGLQKNQDLFQNRVEERQEPRTLGSCKAIANIGPVRTGCGISYNIYSLQELDIAVVTAVTTMGSTVLRGLCLQFKNLELEHLMG